MINPEKREWRGVRKLVLLTLHPQVLFPEKSRDLREMKFPQPIAFAPSAPMRFSDKSRFLIHLLGFIGLHVHVLILRLSDVQ
ncbi:MAG: hypothetical protein K0R76_16 [Alphaproteobacteria bacterium]|jgi:hypothetical protein|nr:hypothetical protein [Alphaproteobacteria bacterium]MDF3033062.1 hypothetical protein [Alphaproteobacteria bacterium]